MTFRMDRSYITPDYTLKRICEYPPFGWEEVFKFAEPEIAVLDRILTGLGEYFPQKHELFQAFDLCPLNTVRVVILGQDPYHSTDDDTHIPQANGMAFATRKGCKVQPSLRNIYEELKNEYPEFIVPNHGDLSSWAKQGVLLLNTCLTVSPHKAGSHMKLRGNGRNESNVNIWSGFITKVFTAIGKVNPNCIFMLWGTPSISVGSDLGKQTVQLLATHPSPLSARRPSKDAPAFIGCGHFKKANEYLIGQGKPPIDWQIQ